MGEIISLHTDGEVAQIKEENALLESTQGLLADARTTLDNKHSLSVPIAELSTLGAGVCSLIPALNTVTQTTTIAANGLYTLANAGVGDVLKVAKNGNFWGAFKTADGASKFAQLQAAGPISATTQAAAAFNPATMKSDITLVNGDKTLIIDTKYYGHTMQHNPMYDSSSIISGNLYQIFTYVVIAR